MIERVIIKNFKGIKEADISFNDKINIIVGNNGVGKSTLIEAIAIALGYGINQLEITQYLFMQQRGKNLTRVRFYLRFLLSYTSIKHSQQNTLERTIAYRY